VLTSSHPTGDVPTGNAAGGTTASPVHIRLGRRVIAVMLLAAAALDLTRCGLVVATARHAGPAAGLVAVGLAAAALSTCTARGCQRGRPWSAWPALLIGATSAPQAAASGFHSPYTIPDTATATLGVLLTVAVLATLGRAGQPGDVSPPTLAQWTGETPDDPRRSPTQPAARRHRAAELRFRGRSGDGRWRHRHRGRGPTSPPSPA
jgi:hypothetical protein